jgi:predicted  nucleic acid-binding Zn-ribbon protein
MSPQEIESDALSGLEERIHEAVELVARLRQEKDAALQAAEEARAQAAKLSEQVRSLEAERKQVRARIEKLLGQIDQLTAE